jgi:hypothetical protein
LADALIVYCLIARTVLAGEKTGLLSRKLWFEALNKKLGEAKMKTWEKFLSEKVYDQSDDYDPESDVRTGGFQTRRSDSKAQTAGINPNDAASKWLKSRWNVPQKPAPVVARPYMDSPKLEKINSFLDLLTGDELAYVHSYAGNKLGMHRRNVA